MRTLLKFEADWCAPCQRLKPVVNEVIEQHPGELELRTINVDDPANQPLVQRHGIRAIPTLVLMDGDRVVSTYRGALGKADLENFIAA